MKKRIVSGMILCLALVVVGCTGEDGARGPAGPAGTANVIYSDWYETDPWVQEAFYGAIERTFTMTTTALTQEIIDHGVVLVYMRFLGISPEICQLPVTVEDVDYRFHFRARAGSIKVAYYSIPSPGTDPGAIPSGNVARYVLIPGGALDEIAGSRGISRSRLIDSLGAMTYEETCGLFEIHE
ncbi:MAG: hypothetical protein JW876_08165 [Candidatus Krumholzibacteriota bacterium]|nr:hypothetical protein [Candidatus Krumholzibacteriota bacterium]